MPVNPTYPGVYIEEIPSGVRTITGVATAITAFIGRALRGPTDEPITINSYGDFERNFGPLWRDSTLGFAVRDFFLNGGGQVIIVRLYHADGANPSRATLDLGGGTTLEAASSGAWGNELQVIVDANVAADVAADFGLPSSALFNLTVVDGGTGVSEVFRNVTVVDSPRRIDRVLLNASRLVRVSGAPGGTVPAAATVDVLTAAEASDGIAVTNDDFIGAGKEGAKQGLYALKKADLFNILCIPPYLADGNVGTAVVTAAAAFCEAHRAFYLVDPRVEWADKEAAKTNVGSIGTNSKNSALFFPRLRQPNPVRDNQLQDFVPCGAVAGVFARTDATRGVWKAPAGLDATLVGVPELSVPLDDAENGELNPLGVNCLRTMPAAGRVVWGARTLRGDDRLASEWKYIPVRRLALYIEESLYRGTQWAVFEPNDEPLWAQIRLNLGAFMQNLFRQGAFQGSSPREAYFVKCDKETTTQNDINLGIVNIVVGFAPLKPAEFVIVKIQQMAGQIAA